MLEIKETSEVMRKKRIMQEDLNRFDHQQKEL